MPARKKTAARKKAPAEPTMLEKIKEFGEHVLETVTKPLRHEPAKKAARKSPAKKKTAAKKAATPEAPAPAKKAAPARKTVPAKKTAPAKKKSPVKKKAARK